MQYKKTLAVTNSRKRRRKKGVAPTNINFKIIETFNRMNLEDRGKFETFYNECYRTPDAIRHFLVSELNMSPKKRDDMMEGIRRQKNALSAKECRKRRGNEKKSMEAQIEAHKIFVHKLYAYGLKKNKDLEALETRYQELAKYADIFQKVTSKLSSGGTLNDQGKLNLWEARGSYSAFIAEDSVNNSASGSASGGEIDLFSEDILKILDTNPEFLGSSR